MNAKEISDATLPAVTPADNDLMLIYDTSEGTTGKATIADIIAIDSYRRINKSIGSTLQSPGWYKICEIGAENEGCALEVNLCSYFNHTPSCSHIIKLAYGYKTCNTLELSSDEYHIFSSIRFVSIDNFIKNIVLVHYSLNSSNVCYALLKGLKSRSSNFTAFNFEPVDASQYSKYIEFPLGDNGAYVNGKKLATVN